MHPGSTDRSLGIVVAIDGPAGSGKSTLARLLAGRMGFRFLDSGAMYRALTLKALRGGADPGDEDEVAALSAASDIRLVDGPSGQRTLLDGEDVSEEIRGTAVTAAVSRVAANPRVREDMKVRQRAFARDAGTRGVVVEGRDIGTVVFPDAAVKFYLDATPAERARRRAAQTGGAPETEMEAMGRRDAEDTGRMVAPLRAAMDAELVDTTGRTVDEVLETLFAAARKRLAGA